jgi:hypothetical protein
VSDGLLRRPWVRLALKFYVVNKGLFRKPSEMVAAAASAVPQSARTARPLCPVRLGRAKQTAA